jgi:hypothetical protein
MGLRCCATLDMAIFWLLDPETGARSDRRLERAPTATSEPE